MPQGQRYHHGPTGSVILSERTTSRSGVVLESKDPYIFECTTLLRGVFPTHPIDTKEYPLMRNLIARFCRVSLLSLTFAPLSMPAFSEQHQERTLDEIKAE